MKKFCCSVMSKHRALLALQKQERVTCLIISKTREPCSGPKITERTVFSKVSLLSPTGEDLWGKMVPKKPKGWVIFAYDVPNEPSKLRLGVWRELKKSGALYPPLSFCILPNTPRLMEQVSKLKEKISRYGNAVILEVKAVGEKDHGMIVRFFEEERKRRYAEILEECHEFLQEIENNIAKKKLTAEEVEEMEESLSGLERWFVRIRAMDWNHSVGSKKVEQALEKCKKAFTNFAERVQPR